MAQEVQESYDASRRAAVAPDQSTNQVDAVGDRTSKAEAKRIAEHHRKSLSRRRYHDLTAEKYMLHVDGEGDNQWADILYGERVDIPPSLTGSPRAQHNLLRPLVTNMVAYHTTMPLELAVEAPLSTEAREAARVDELWINHQAQRQRWNALFAEAMYFAAAYGSCPVHAYWRDDMASDPYDPVYLDADEVQMPPRAGGIDAWVGDPFDTTYNPGATRGSIQMAQYGRTLPADLVRRAFSDSLEEQGISLEGSTKLPSAARFQRIARRWLQSGLNVHGTSAIYAGEQSGEDEELVALICRETAPNVDPDWPEGRLQIIALNGAASTNKEETFAGGGNAFGDPVLLHDGPLPGGTLSFVTVYSTHRYDDVLGKPFVADLDDLQVQLNQLHTWLNEYIRRAGRAPWAVPKGSEMNMETAFWDWDVMLEYDPPATGSGTPQITPLRPVADHVPIIQERIEEIEKAMFRIGGWQAASRGEADSGDSGRKVIALAQYDDTIHGPTNQRFRETVEDFAGICWRLAKEQMEVPQLIDVTGDEVAHLADPWVDRTMLSEEPPTFRVISGSGATPEARAEHLLNLMQTTDAEGRALISADEVRRRWPDHTVFPDIESAEVVAKRRPRQVNARIKATAKKVAQQQGIPQNVPVAHPEIQEMGGMIHQTLYADFPVLPDDDLVAHLEELSTLTQDETEHPVVRATAMHRQRIYMGLYQERQAQMMEAQMQMEHGEAPTESGGEGGAERRDPTSPGTQTAAAGERAASAFERTPSAQQVGV